MLVVYGVATGFHRSLAKLPVLNQEESGFLNGLWGS